MDLQVETEVYQDYDDNNNFDARRVCSVMGIQVEWHEWTLNENIPKQLEELKTILISNSFLYIAEPNKKELLLAQIEQAKAIPHERWPSDTKFDPDVLNLFIEFVKKDYDLDEAVEELKDYSHNLGAI